MMQCRIGPLAGRQRGEDVGEQIPGWAQDIRESVARIETKLERYTDTQDKAQDADSRSKENERRLDKLEESHTWLWRTVSGAIIAGAIGSVIAFLGHIH